MEPKVVSRPAFTVVGMRYHGKNEENEIPQLWQAFGPRVKEIRHIQNPHVCYGISDNIDEASGEFDYIAGYEVSSAEDVPEGMVSWEVPASNYAVFTCTLPTIGETFHHAYHTWMPKSGYERARGPDYEVYDERFDPSVPESEFALYIPIE